MDEWQAAVAVGGDVEKATVTRLQIINPASGKGANAAKTGTLSIGGLSGFWLLEYLKFVGLFTLGVPLVVKGSKDRKTYVLRPVAVELNAIERIMDTFRKRVSGSTAVKVDVVTALRFTEALVTYLRDAVRASQSDPMLALFKRTPRLTDIARGFDVAFYKDMGSAFATMNLATINLPDWLDLREPLATPAQAEGALASAERASARYQRHPHDERRRGIGRDTNCCAAIATSSRARPRGASSTSPRSTATICSPSSIATSGQASLPRRDWISL